MPELKFIEDTHTYLVDGQKWPSVTQIIAEAGLSDYSMIPAVVLEKARQWGNAVHKMVELYLKNDLDEDVLDEPLKKPLEAFQLWNRSEHGFVFDSYNATEGPRIECPNFNQKLKYCGTPDIVDMKRVIDVKSRPVNMLTDPLQLVAYDELDGGDREHRILIVNQDGTYLYQRVNATKAARKLAWSRFRYILDLHYRKVEISKWR